MYKKLVCLVVTFLVLLSLTFCPPIMKTVRSTPTEIIVPDDYPTIQEAIDNASMGDIIRVKPRIYYENIFINKSVKLIGENPLNTIIDGRGGGNIIHIIASNVSVANFTILNGENFGIQVAKSASNTTIRNNIIRNNLWGGIHLFREATNNIIIDNKIIGNLLFGGVKISDNSNNNSIIGNTMVNNFYGIFIDNSSYNTLYRNNFINNTNQYGLYGTSNINWDNGAEGNYWSDYIGVDADGDGIGDTGYPDPQFPLDKYPLIEPWSLIRVFDIHQKAEPSGPILQFKISINCNSTVGTAIRGVSFLFSQQERQIRFNVTGPSNTTGFCNVTIPKQLLNCTNLAEWEVRLDGVPMSFPNFPTPTDNETHTFVYFTYNHSTRKVQVIGTNVIGNLPPIANFTYSPLKPTILDFVNFADTSTDPDGAIIGRFWDFGDGNNWTDPGLNATCFHRYEKRGTYHMTLTVVDSVQATNTTAKNITVVNAPPTANFTFSPTAPEVDQEIEFTDTSTDPEESITERLWNFGDGNVTRVTTPVITNITYTYTAAGTYNVTLTVKDDENATNTIFRIITVRQVGTKIILNVPPTATAGSTIIVTATLKDESDNPIPSKNIDFYARTNGEWKKFNSAPTNATGVASVMYPLAIWGDHQITAYYNGSARYFENYITRTIFVNPLVVNLTINAPDPLTLILGKKITITATLKDESGVPIPNATIEFARAPYLFKDGTWETIGSSETDSYGVAVLEYTPPATGKFYIKAEFLGTPIYGETSVTITLIVNFDFIPYILVGVAAIAAIALIAFAIWRKRKKTPKSEHSQE